MGCRCVKRHHSDACDVAAVRKSHSVAIGESVIGEWLKQLAAAAAVAQLAGMVYELRGEEWQNTARKCGLSVSRESALASRALIGCCGRGPCFGG